MISAFLIGAIIPIIVIYLIALFRSDSDMDKDVRQYFPNLWDEE